MLAEYFQDLLHIDTYLISIVNQYGSLTYVLLFLVIFCETGLVIMPFLPGDSLLFAAGSIAANAAEAFDIRVLFVLLVAAAILGNKTNYLLGRFIGPRVFRAENSWLLNKRHLAEAHTFYEKHGGKTIILARFLPIIRTFVPFVAGAGSMTLRSFTFYNTASGFLWVGSLLSIGYYFGSVPFVQAHFSLVVYGIIAASLVPAIAALVRKAFR